MSKLVTDDCVSSLVDKHVGKTNISGVGDGTITGAISSLNSGLQNIATATLCNYGSETNSIGGLFGYDFLNVDINNRFADVNKLSAFNSFEYKDFKNKPQYMPDQCMGYREVIWVNNQCAVVKLTQTYPNSGRQYYNLYASGWQGWMMGIEEAMRGFIGGAYSNIDAASDGSSFACDFLNVNQTERLVENHKPAAFNMGYGYSLPNFQNKPPQMPDQCMGFREVIWVANGVSFVRITETSPVCGRQYYNYYISGVWNGWKCITPQS